MHEDGVFGRERGGRHGVTGGVFGSESVVVEGGEVRVLLLHLHEF